jgi:hypothetical protein
MLSKEDCKEILLKDCKIIGKDGKYFSSTATKHAIKRNKELYESILFYTSKLSLDHILSERIYWIIYNIF